MGTYRKERGVRFDDVLRGFYTGMAKREETKVTINR